MKIFACVLLGVLSVGSVFAQRPAQPPMSQEQFTPEKLGYSLFWEDNFDGNQLDAKK